MKKTVLSLTLFAFMTAIPAIAAPSCNRMIADDTKALLAATAKLRKACVGDDMKDRCTKAIDDGDKVMRASDAVAALCPKGSY
jgi:hypothetical protein